MLQMVQVRCPHCEICGQIVLPPMGAMIVGPCPNCNEIVIVFCGRALPLVKDIMVNGNSEQREAHLRTIIFDFLIDRIKKVVDQLTPEVTESLYDYAPEHDNYVPPPLNHNGTLKKLPDLPTSSPQPKLRGSGPITAEEVNFFLNHEITHLDEGPYFRRQFEGK